MSHHDVGPAEQAIIDGTPDEAHAFTLALRHRRSSCATPPGLVCSSVLIGPETVLTAAHCVVDAQPGELEIFAGPAGLSSPRAVVEIRHHPAFDLASLEADLATLRLGEPLSVRPADRGAAPAIGDVVTVVGYGVSAFSATEASSNERLMAEARVTRVNAGVFRMTPVSGGPCIGDSGGAVLDAGGSLVGLIRGGSPDCSGDASATRVDRGADFIAEVLASPITPPSRPLALECFAACDLDTDCPLGERCLATFEGPRCGTSVGVGVPGDACSLDEDCPGSVCASFGLGSAAECACMEPCRTPAAAGGCAVSSSSDGSPWRSLVLATLVLGLLIRRARCSSRRRA